ncbi:MULTISPECIES: MBL fold metallo-hydrolase [unclassified Ruminococcus]|uniref:MBL fold metallo-hydrolase n=1 Tax=unclassified Ruminococcus TaxID=2608920 RepID=UPI00210BC2F2|nr:MULTISPECIES: MBL fold metallo-hydrolase [unclassified Ruminococcus]MCQ4023206.1 MBL fold metallo-hydrolase [Ruminococcus sp. zg-924]MCQ4115424.1 MBL fold metallo-hydrolase [Ruminococcus sp. zg-921]
MKATVIVDNIKNDGIPGEWGLSIYIEYNGKKILLDTGASNLFVKNARKLNISLKDIDLAVLSHAHYDHANGMRDFFEINDKALFYLQDGCAENCYAGKWIFHKYIGIPKGVLATYKNRIVYTSGDYEISDGISLIPHKTAGLENIGKREGMYQRTTDGWVPDNFSHEQSLVFDTPEGLVIFNSCSHGGVANIINEVAKTYPQKKVLALIGGFHIFNKPESKVREFAKDIKNTGIKYLYTGHCTGKKSFKILKEELGDIVRQFKVGLVMEF